MQQNELNTYIKQAVGGDQNSLELVIAEVHDLIFNLSLRMLGMSADAQDATQDILVKVITSLSSFRFESRFQTWVYRIAANYLIDYKKSMFAQHPLDFEFYANDLRASYEDDKEELMMNCSKEKAAEELKLSCTNVMLQCFDPETRCIYILGTMFRADSKTAGEILNMTPENYRQRLSRARKKMGDFLAEYCGAVSTGFCRCDKRLSIAMDQHRLDPQNLEYSAFRTIDRNILHSCMNDMNEIEDISDAFQELPGFCSPVSSKEFLETFLHSKQLENVKSYKEKA